MRAVYMKAAAFNEVTAKNAVALNDLATQIKLNIHVQDKLSNIKCPTLLIYGKDDFIVEEVSCIEIAKQGGLFRCVTLPLVRD